MKDKLKIAFYCSSLSWGGLEMNIYKRALWMSQRGHDVYLFCVEDTPIHKNAKDVNLVIVNRNKKGFDWKNAKTLKQHVLKYQIDVIWFTDKRDLSLLALTKVLAKKSFKLLYQQCMQLGVNKKEFWHTIRFNKIDYWVAPLHYLKQQVKEKTKFPSEKVHVIHQGLDLEHFLNNLPDRNEARTYFNLKEDDVVVGMVGRIDFAKAQQFVMDAVVDVQHDYKNLKMLMVGNKTEGEWEDYYNEIVERIAKHHTDGSVQLYPFMSQVGYFYAATDIFVMASKNETYGMVTIESMLSGNQIIGTNAAGTKELLGDGERGYLFEWMDSDSFKSALRHVLKNPEASKEKGIKASEYAKKAFSHKAELDQIESLINV